MKTIAEMKNEIMVAEQEAITTVMQALRRAEVPLTAETLSARTGGVMSARQVRANIQNIGVKAQYRSGKREMASRFAEIASEQKKLVTTEKRVVKMFAELDESGCVVENGETLTIEKETKFYQLNKRF